ncbi:MAG: VOC family protein [Kangiellaceae bacterium]|nr:VOC family protein [Kangiellaceae bacterium]
MKKLFCLIIFSFITSAILSSSCFAEVASSEKNKPALTLGFDHVGLSVSNLDATTNFFVDTLGWELRGGDPSYPAKFVSDGKMFLTLWQTANGKNAVEFNRRNNVGLHHLAFTVASFEELEEIHRRVKSVDGVVVEFPPELAYGGPKKHMMIREPSGNRLEFAHSPR